MDSNTPLSGPSSSLRSNRKRKAKTPAMGKSKKAKFNATYIHQRFSLPESIMHYVATNPSTTEVYQKMTQSCKYFFVKNQIFVISRLVHYGDHWRVNNGRKSFDFNKGGCKYWISNELHFGPKDLVSDTVVNQNLMSAVIPKLYRCDAKRVTLFNQIISYHDFSFLTASAEDIIFENVTVKNDDGSNVPAEKIVEVAVKAKRISLNGVTVTSKTMEEFIKIPHFAELDKFLMSDLSENFDLEAFYGYMKTNKRTKFWLGFDKPVSDAYKNRLEAIVDELLATKVFNYKPTCFIYVGLDEGKYKKLHRFRLYNA